LLKSGENFKKEKKNEPKFSQFDPDNPFRLSFTEDGFKEEHITSALCFNEISTNGQTFKIDKEKENQYFTDFNGMVLFFRIEKLIEIEMQGEKVVHYAKVKFFNTKKIMSEFLNKFQIDIHEFVREGAAYNPYIQLNYIKGYFASCQCKTKTYLHPLPFSNVVFFEKNKKNSLCVK